MGFAGINHVAILVAAVASWLAGAIWYTLLGRPWLAALNKSKAELTGSSGRPSPAPLVVSFAAELVMAWVLAGIIGHSGPVTVQNGLVAGFLAWLGFVMTSTVVNHGFSGQKPSHTLIDGGYWLAVLLVQGGGHRRAGRLTTRSDNKKGRPRGQPFHCQTAVRPGPQGVAAQAARTSAEARIQAPATDDRGLRQ